MTGRRFALIAAFAFFAMFVASNLIVNSWFRSWRLDLTANHLYSLSPGTRDVLDHLAEPVELTFYYSRDVAAGAPPVQAYGARVREMLQTFAANSHGRVRFVEVNVKRFSEEEDKAGEAGIQPQQLFEGADPLYFGLTGANAIDDKRAIPFFNPQREPFLEYEVTRLIYELENPEPTHVALITSLPIDPSAAQDPQGQSGQWAFATDMGRLMHVDKLAPDFTDIPADTDVLAIIHPSPLTPAQTYAVDQFILRHGRAFIALDPASLIAQRAAGQMAMLSPEGVAGTSSTLEPLLSRWGVAMSSEVVLDLESALTVTAQNANGQSVPAPQPLFFKVDPDRLDRHDLMTASLNRGLTFGLAGALTWSERPNLHVTPLARTTGHTLRMAAQRALMRPSPFEIMQEPEQAPEIDTVALHLSGPLQTAFPDGPPEGVPAGGAAQLRQSATPAEIVIVSDSDFLADDFYVDPQSGAQAFDNSVFVLNAIDVLRGSSSLVSLRSRAASTRSMTLIDRMEADAQRRIERRQQELQGELEDTEGRLTQLQSHGHGSGFFNGNLSAALTQDEAREIEHFRAQVAQVRGELRRVQRDLRGDINQLEALFLFLDMWLGPLVVAGVGLFLFWRRQKRTGARR